MRILQSGKLLKEIKKKREEIKSRFDGRTNDAYIEEILKKNLKGDENEKNKK